MMPQLVVCHKCGAILPEGEELKSPYEIIESYEGKCPTCSRKLSDVPKTFEVKPVDETSQLRPLESEKTIKKKESEQNKET
jgi:DNA-directed RNA polymerase subunit RPC12/RpoP